jgi:membrane dipeptidase
MGSLAPKLFDYGLDAAQEERARRLHDQSIIIDMLFQGPTSGAVFSPGMVDQVRAEYEKHRSALRTYLFAHDLPIRAAVRGELPEFEGWWRESGITAGNRQLQQYSMSDSMHSMALATFQFDHFPWLQKALRAADIRAAKAANRMAAFISTQNTIALGQDLENLSLFHDFGVRMIQLTYNNMNFVGAGCTERSDAGVSNFGVKFIERMNRLGILVDTGHCGRQTTLDACEISSAPAVASHACAKTVSGHARGKSDAEMEAIARTGGVVGVVLAPSFLVREGEADMNDFLDHIDYMVKKIGWQHVGIGSDWPMTVPAFVMEMVASDVAPTIGFRPQDRLPTSETVIGFEDYRCAFNITRGLAARRYTDEQIQGILGENWMRVIEQVW